MWQIMAGTTFFFFFFLQKFNARHTGRTNSIIHASIKSSQGVKTKIGVEITEVSSNKEVKKRTNIGTSDRILRKVYKK